MLSDEELSELSSEEDQLATENPDVKTETPSSRARTTASSGYKLQKALKPPRATTYTAQALYDQIHSGDINLEPEYQRDVVWTKEKQTNLIDSILRNFYIPPIIFAVRVYDDGSESKTCIDGKQRLTSIHRFMDGVIPHRDPITLERLWFKDDTSTSTSRLSQKRKILPEKYRTMFANKQVVCVEYGDLTDADERDIFQRVQLGMALTSAEKLHVINTPRAQFIRQLLIEFVNDDTLGSSAIPWDKSRGSDFRCIAQAVYNMEKWPSGKGGTAIKNAGSLPQVEKWLNGGKDKKAAAKAAAGVDDEDYTDGADVSEAFARRVRETYSIMVQMASDEKLSGPFTSYPKVSPIEMICFALLVYVHGVLPSGSGKMQLAELSTSIDSMRDDVRDMHKDIRMNDRVGKTMIEFIQDLRKPSSSKKSKKTAKAESASAPVPTKTTGGKGKRKRISEANASSDEDYQEAPRRRTTGKTRTQVGVRSKPLPTPESSSTASGSRPDHLASARAAKAASSRTRRYPQRAESPPNPQRLPSPGPASESSGDPTQTQPQVKVEGMVPGMSQQQQQMLQQQQLAQLAMMQQMPGFYQGGNAQPELVSQLLSGMAGMTPLQASQFLMGQGMNGAVPGQMPPPSQSM